VAFLGRSGKAVIDFGEMMARPGCAVALTPIAIRDILRNYFGFTTSGPVMPLPG
jgi:hypothetical protein